MSNAYGDGQVVTAGDISRNFGLWQDKALSGPVMVTHHGRSRVVLVSAEHYAALEAGGVAARGPDRGQAGFETSLAAVLDHTGEGFMALDARLHVTAVNHVFKALVGLSSSQIIGRCWEELFAATAQSVIGEQLRRALRSGEAVDFEAVTDSLSGRRYAIRAFPYPGGVAALILNKTAEREMHRELQAAKASEAALSALSQVMIVRLNVRGVLAEVGSDFASLTGFSREELLTCRLADVIQPRDRVALNRVLEELLQGSGPREFATTLLVKNGDERPVRIGAAAILNDLSPDGVVAALSLVGD
ncbi:PAS domain-containing protein [Phenylobacterium sp.]|uniref:PAS domain-containing protein n=1 Tax=Phenylobacterium sp. TaxID=1871053 RepID=UPI002FC9E6E1